MTVTFSEWYHIPIFWFTIAISVCFVVAWIKGE